jgi:hypothetical protein
MSDRSNSPGHAGPQTDASPRQDEARRCKARAGRHLRLVKKVPPAASAAGAETTRPSRKSHLARLVEALHASRRIQAAQVTRRYLHLVK